MKKVLCVDTGEVFSSLFDVKDCLGVSIRNIGRSLRRRIQLSSGHCFIYLEDAEAFEKENSRKIESSDFKKIHHYTKGVFCIELNQVFSSIKEAGKALNIPSNNIVAACKGKLKTAGRLHWVYLEEAKKFEEKNNRQITINDFEKSYKLDSVVCVETGQVFFSAAEASRITKTNHHSLLSTCKGKQTTAGGKHWVYKKDAMKFEEENNRPISVNDIKKTYPFGKPVLCVELNRKFPSIRIAAEELKINYASIIGACKKRKLTAGGYHWIYVSEAKTFEDKHNRPISVNDFKKSKHIKPVFCLELQKEFLSINEAAEATGVHSEGIVAVCRGRELTAGGYHWIYTKDAIKFQLEKGRMITIDDFKKSSRFKPVLCVELNKKFSSIKDAALSLGIDKSSISLACRGKLKSAGGHHWKFANEGEIKTSKIAMKG